jgi:hypothetical protein
MNVIKQLFFYNLFFCLFITTSLFAQDREAFRAEFSKSFLTYYELNGAGRYAHEYHPFLLDKTAKSLDELEDALVEEEFDVKGRIVIAGYEEQAVPAFYTNIKDHQGNKINDEASTKNKIGWSLRLHNRFGLMTGFLFRYCNHIEKVILKSEDPLFEHINAHAVDIFEKNAVLYQHHAFGNIFPTMLDEQEKIEKIISKKDTDSLFETLINFWQTLYDYEIKNGDRHVAGTQDILFSIEHARHVKRSKVPLFKYFAGPDITYPIKISKNQKKAATFHAQTFVNRFLENSLKKYDNKPTAYIFNSFVDGVGKSTMLGNVRNVLKNGNKYEQFDQVDNSSSQLAAIYDCGNDIYIADLPAQMSHFTYKPDGLVYADTKVQLTDLEEVDAIEEFVIKNKEQLFEKHKRRCQEVENILLKKSWFCFEVNNEYDPEKAFIKNLFLLKKFKTNRWVTFIYKGKHYIFDYSLPASVRILVPLADVDSIGLKNPLAEQMLFFEGIMFPCAYKAFMRDLVDKLRAQKIEKIVFVDFLSMFPRSSRENIRINYLIQQLALINKQFDVAMSPYADFVSDAHLFHTLKNDHELKILDALKSETFTRLALYEIMKQVESNHLTILPIDKLTFVLDKVLSSFSDELGEKINKLSTLKIKQERKNLERIYGSTKDYVNVQEFNVKDVVTFSERLQELFSEQIDNRHIKELWIDQGAIIESIDDLQDGYVNKPVLMQDGERATLLFIFDKDCKNEQILAPFFRIARASWYASLSNLMNTKRVGKNFHHVKEKYRVPPIKVIWGSDGRVCVVQKLLDDWYKDAPKKNKNELFHIAKKSTTTWGDFRGLPYCVSWDNKGTHNGLYAYGCDMSWLDYKQRYPFYSAPNVTYIVKDFQKKEDSDVVLPATDAYEKWVRQLKRWHYTEEHSYWETIVEQLKKHKKLEEPKTEEKSEVKKKKTKKDVSGSKETEKTEAVKTDEDEEEDDTQTNYKKRRPKKFVLCTEEHEESVRFVIRALATLEMILKDVKSDIVIRRGNKDDFASSIKLLEKVTMPIYFGTVFERDLFHDYRDAKTIIPFHDWDELA